MAGQDRLPRLADDDNQQNVRDKLHKMCASRSVVRKLRTGLSDEGRLDDITTDRMSCVADGRSPLVLADRKTYLERLEQSFASRAPEVTRFRLDGLVGKKARKDLLHKIDDHYSESRPFVLFATASLVGEGFDLPQLDTLVLAMPISFKKRLVQYAGRLHRSHEAKRDVLIFDYLDENHAVTNAMFRRRLTGYGEMGYRIERPQDGAPGLFA